MTFQQDLIYQLNRIANALEFEQLQKWDEQYENYSKKQSKRKKK